MDQHDDTSQPPDKASSEERPLLNEPKIVRSRPPTFRKRLTQLGWIVLAGVILLGGLWGVFFHKAPAPPNVQLQPTQTFPMLDINSNVGFGTVTINGLTQSGPPPLHLTMQTPPPYTVTINAPPFTPLSCRIGGDSTATLPPQMGGGCSKAYGYPESGSQAPPSLILNITFTLDNLPPDQQSKVTALIPHIATISQMVAVPAQSYIATSVTPAGVIGTQRSPVDLQATATFAPSTFFNQPMYACQNLLCYNIFGMSATSLDGNSWAVSVPVALGWRFTDVAGKVVGGVSLPYADLLALDLTYDQTQGWQAVMHTGAKSITAQLQELACGAGATMLQLQVARLLSGEGWNATSLTNKGLEGCLLDLQQNTVEQGHFLWRFGVIMAADAKAHANLPTLPVAPPDEIAAVTG